MTVFLDLTAQAKTWLGSPLVRTLLASGLILVIGLPIAAFIARMAYRVTAVRFSAQAGLMISRVIRWLLFALVLATVLNQFGVKLGAALGAAGIAGIAIGFAAQTSLSNVISGFFLLGEKPFVIGDLIEVDGISGVIDNIGMISATLRTMDNRSVRIPNETLVKSKVINITKNPIRRYDMEISVSYQENIDHVLRVLRETAEANEHCLDEPDPLVLFSGFGPTSLNFVLGVWMAREDYLVARNTIARDVQCAFRREGIETPLPQMMLGGEKYGHPIAMNVERAGKNPPRSN